MEWADLDSDARRGRGPFWVRRHLGAHVGIAGVLCALALWNATQASTVEVTPQIYSSRVWQARDGLPQDSVHALAQTPDGYLWVGTSGGLYRFDGVRFVGFTRDNTAAFQDDTISCLYVAPDGSLWIGTEGGGLVRYYGGRFESLASTPGLSNLFIRAIYQDSRAVVWVGTDAGVFRLEEDRFVRVDGRGGVPPMNVYTITEDQRGRVLVGGLGLLVWDNGRVTVHSSRDKAADWMVNTLRLANDGALWIGTFAHLRRVPPAHTGNPFTDKFTIEIFSRGAETARRAISRYHISAITETRDGDVWIGTWGQGLMLLRQGELRRFRAPGFLPDDNVWTVLEDSEGNLWVGTESGLVRLNRRLATTVTANGLAVNIRTVYSEPGGKLWMVSAAGQLFELRGDSLVPARLPSNLAGIPLRTVFRDRAGAFWAGTDGHGVFRLGAPRLTRYAEAGAPNFVPLADAPYFTRAFCEDAAGNLWIGADSGLSRFRDGRFTWIPDVPHSVRAVTAGRAGDLWVGTDTGAYRLQQARVVPESTLGPLRAERVWAIHEDSKGGVWFGTRGAGLFLLTRGKLTRIHTGNGLPSNTILSIIEDRQGALWMSSPNGVFSIQRSELERLAADADHRFPVRFYGTSEGLSTRQMNGGVQPAGTLAADGELWFASSGGAARIHPGALESEGLLPVIVEQVLANGHAVPLSGELHLGPSTRDLEIHYTAIRLQSPERVRFRYRLEGFDTAWNEAGERRVAYYTNVPAGTYRFRLAAYDVNLPDKIAEADLRLRLDRYFYRSWWFFALCALTAVAIAALAYMIHLRQIRRRFALVLEERSRLAREMHDTLIQGCIGVSTLLEAASSVRPSSPAAGQELVERAREQVQITIDDARRAVWRLREQSGGTGTLATGLLQSAARVTRESGIAVTCSAMPTAVPLSEEVQYNLLLVAREAMNNAVRHAAATRIGVDLSVSEHAVSLAISDDGSGFDASTVAGPHYGIIGMRERLADMGGELLVESQANAGTVVRAVVPCGRAAGLASKTAGAKL